jgi:C1A family cysteine protease
MTAIALSGLGWHRDLPDPRDYCAQHEQVQALLTGLRRKRSARGAAPCAFNCEEYLSVAAAPLALRASTAQACVTLVEYFDRRVHGCINRGSCRFLYRMARQLAHLHGDTGVPFRATLKALRRFGLPPHEYWPDDAGEADEEPSAFLFSYAAEFEALTYFRLDPSGASGKANLAAVKAFLGAGLPVAFGFGVFDSLSMEAEIPFPTCYDRLVAGTAAVALGFDDSRRIRSEKGALRIRTCLGREWGETALGWLPYRYVLDLLAVDFWCMLRPDWVANGSFSSPW